MCWRRCGGTRATTRRCAAPGTSRPTAPGSGVVESACGAVAGRLKRGGMRWSAERGANPMLTLRCWWIPPLYTAEAWVKQHGGRTLLVRRRGANQYIKLDGMLRQVS